MPESSAESDSAAVSGSVDGPSVYDHVRPRDESATDATGAGVESGIYRVVGTGADAVTLLRVGDADGRRVNTGRVVSVDRDALAAFEPAQNPDGNRSAVAAASGFADSLVWQIRTFGRGLAARPLPALAGIGLLVLGARGDQYVDAPGAAFTAAYFLGAAAVIYVGTRGG